MHNHKWTQPLMDLSDRQPHDHVHKNRRTILVLPKMNKIHWTVKILKYLRAFLIWLQWSHFHLFPINWLYWGMTRTMCIITNGPISSHICNRMIVWKNRRMILVLPISMWLDGSNDDHYYFDQVTAKPWSKADWAYSMVSNHSALNPCYFAVTWSK